MFNVETDCGIATARVDGKYIDAGRSGDMAGIEFSVEALRLFDASRRHRHADAMITLDCTPSVLLRLATAILDTLELPAFNDREWRMIANALRFASNEDQHGAELRQMARKIEASAAKIDAL